MKGQEVLDTQGQVALNTYTWGDKNIILPGRFTELRPHQVTALHQIEEAFGGGAEVVFVDAPTGAGKTLIGEFTRQIVAPAERSIYVCTTKTLQDQFLREFPIARLIQGRSNYPTVDDPEHFPAVNASLCNRSEESAPPFGCITCEDGGVYDERLFQEEDRKAPTLYHCDWCHPWQDCPYRLAKNTALGSRLAVLNTAYMLTEANYVGAFGATRTIAPDGTTTTKPTVKGITVIDEADTLEGVLQSTVALTLSARQLRRLNMPATLIHPKHKTKVDSWVTWVEIAKVQASEQLQRLLKRYGQALRYNRHELADIIPELRSTDRLIAQLGEVHEALKADPDNWLYQETFRGGLEFKPVLVDKVGPKWVWRHINRGLLMSATLISPEQMAADLGLDKPWASVRVDSSFPTNRRRIIAMPVAVMSHKNKDDQVPKMVNGVVDVLRQNDPKYKVLIHTVSYSLADAITTGIKQALPDRIVFTYKSSAEREHQLGLFRDSPTGVIVAPSLDRGVDLPDDDVRIIIVAKVPFPNLGDKQVSKRFYGGGARGRSWYAAETVRTIVQMTGRGMRHTDDWVITYILDGQFQAMVWRRNRHLIPRWWAEAVEWHEPRKTSPEMTRSGIRGD